MSIMFQFNIKVMSLMLKMFILSEVEVQILIELFIKFLMKQEENHFLKNGNMTLDHKLTHYPEQKKMQEKRLKSLLTEQVGNVP